MAGSDRCIQIFDAVSGGLRTELAVLHCRYSESPSTHLAFHAPATRFVLFDSRSTEVNSEEQDRRQKDDKQKVEFTPTLLLLVVSTCTELLL